MHYRNETTFIRPEGIKLNYDVEIRRIRIGLFVKRGKTAFTNAHMIYK